MRKVLISIAATASAVAFATPAAAQPNFPQPQGYAHGYHNNYGQVRSLQRRIDQLQRRIARLDSRDRVTEREARRLRAEARQLEQRLRYAAHNGLSGREHASIANGIARLEYRMARDARDGNRWGGNDNWRDRDRDGRNDRHEDDRGTRHD